MDESKEPFYLDEKWKLGDSSGWWHTPYCPHCGAPIRERKEAMQEGGKAKW